MLLDLAAFTGRLIGSMVDPIGPMVAAAAAIALKRWPLLLRFAVALAAMFAIGLFIDATDKLSFLVENKTERTVFALLSTSAWFWIIVGVRRLLYAG